MTTRISPKSPSSRAPKAQDPRQLKGSTNSGSTSRSLSEKFGKDEMSMGRANKLKAIAGPLLERAHNLQVAGKLKSEISDILKRVRWAGPTPAAEAPRAGKNGQMVAPNGDPLIRVKLDDGKGIAGAGQYALVNPKTNEFFIQNNSGGIKHQTTYYGPLSLPPAAQFKGDKFTPGELKNLEKAANAPPKFPSEFPNWPKPGVPTLPLPGKPGRDALVMLKAMAALKGGVEFDQKAPNPKNVASEVVLKNEHPFTYYAVTLKNDPDHVIIKKVLTGGFVPAKPGDGSYSAPIPLSTATAAP